MKRLVVIVAMCMGLLYGSGNAAAWDRDRPGGPGTGLGLGLEAGGGVLAYTRGQLANLTQTGGGWALRLIIGTRSYLAGEVAYVGSANTIGLGGLTTSAQLIGTGLEGALRLQLPVWLGERGRGLVLPYILAGVGWSRYDVLDSNNNFNSGTNGLTVPLGGGLILGYRHLLFDARAQYRLGYYNNPLRLGDDTSGTDNWSLTFHVGYEF